MSFKTEHCCTITSTRRAISFLLVSLLLLQHLLIVSPLVSRASTAPAPTVAAMAPSTSLVISQFQVAGATSAADEFIELHNVGLTDFNLNGHRLVYRSAGGTSDVSLVAWTSNTIIPAGGFYLVAGINGYTGTAQPNQTFSNGTNGSLSGTSGGLAIRNGAANTGLVIDSVGYGSATNAFVETATTTEPASGRSKTRLNNGCADTDNNSADFTLQNPSAPRNALSTPVICGGAASIAPSGTGQAVPGSVAPGGSTLLTVKVTPGSNPASTVLNVVANLSAVGGSATQRFFDDGSNGDQIAGDKTFSYTATIASGTSGGAKTLPFTVSDQSRSSSGNISLTVLSPTNPSASGSANPNPVAPGASTVLTVNVTPGTNPTSSGLSVTGDLSSIGGAANQSFIANGNNSFVYQANVPVGTSGGAKSIPIIVSDAEGRAGSAAIALSIIQPANHVVISQIYGGGGNTGAAYQNDYVELYNPTTNSFNLAGWSLQYASAAGTTWTNKQPLGGILSPGEYYLVALGSGGAAGQPLPQANIAGEINLSGSNGKVALVRNGESLVGGCPLNDTDLVDFVGYGTANCSEGGTAATEPSAVNAIFRKAGGAIDSDINGSDFVAQSASPRRTTPIQEIGPSVLYSDPFSGETDAPKDASLTIDFTEPVTVDAGWYDIACASGRHNDATLASSNNGKTWVITPNVNFTPGEQCTVILNKDSIHDVDTDDAAPDTDTLPANYTWTFNAIAAGEPAPYPPGVHLTMGNPTNAVNDINQPNNYLMEKPGFVLSYNRGKGTPNWVSWHLEDVWTGKFVRDDTFRPDPAVPSDWYRVQATDYFVSGFDRGHLTPNADRDNLNRIPINQETFLMSNIIPQAPDNNQGPWANLENYLRTLLTTNEIYIVAGGAGVGGTGSNGFANTIAGGRVTVPAQTWKVALVIPKGDGDDVSRVTAAARTIAVIMPNTQGIRTKNLDDWQAYLKSVDDVERLTGYNFFANLPDAVENSIEAGVNGVNPPGTEDQTINAQEDTPQTIYLNAASPNNNLLTYTIVSSPAHGTLTGSGANRTYVPAANYYGTDSFTFKVNDGARESNVSTVTINVASVNDAPVLAPVANQSLIWGNTISFNASATDIDVPANTLTYSLNRIGGNVPASISFNPATGSFGWTPTGAESGTYNFSITVNDNSGAANATATQNFSIAVNRHRTALVYTGATSGQYSDAIALSATLMDLDTNTQLTGYNVAFQLGSQSASGFSDGSANAGASLVLDQPAQIVSVTPSFAGDTAYLPGTGASQNFTISPENAVITASASNPSAVKVSTPGGTAGPITLQAEIAEVPDASPGDVTKAVPVTFTLMPVGPGSSITQTATALTNINGKWTASVSLSNVPVNVYDVKITIGGNYYVGSTATVLSVYDPSLGFTTGGGKVIHNGVLAEFGFNVKYLRNGNVQGHMIYVEHRPTGDVTVKSNAMDSLSIVRNSGDDGSTAVFLGRATVAEVGNYRFRTTVVDNGEPGTNDQFGLQITTSTGEIVTHFTFSPIVLNGGNIQVP